MSRRLIAFLIALVAIFFAFACLTAIRWPSMMMVVTLFFHPDPSLGLELVNWRELGFAYGAPYFLASLCFYASAATVSRKKGGLAWYLMGCASASPALFMVSFKDGWWMDPSGPQGILAVARAEGTGARVEVTLKKATPGTFWKSALVGGKKAEGAAIPGGGAPGAGREEERAK